MTELCAALAVQENDVHLADDNLVLPDYVVETCGGLVIYEKETGVVTFSYETIWDFLKSRFFEFFFFQRWN